MATHHTPDGLQLKLRLAAGRCEITTADTAETVVEAQPLNGSNASREAVELLVETLRERAEGVGRRLDRGRRRGDRGEDGKWRRRARAHARRDRCEDDVGGRGRA
jgi:hypothetical protein